MERTSEVFCKKQSVNRLHITFFIALFAIIMDEGVNNILIESVSALTQKHSWLVDSFMAMSIPFSLLLAGWSDSCSRRKALIFAVTSIFISVILIWFYKEFGNNWMAGGALIIKAIGGNAIPVALASIADIMPSRKFRSSLAIAICAISVGSWTAIPAGEFSRVSKIFLS